MKDIYQYIIPAGRKYDICLVVLCSESASEIHFDADDMEKKSNRKGIYDSGM
jgi:hypothetical protein